MTANLSRASSNDLPVRTGTASGLPRFSGRVRSGSAAGFIVGALMIVASAAALAAPPAAVVYVPAPARVWVAASQPSRIVVAPAPLPAVVVKATPLPRALYVAPHTVYVARPAVAVPGHWARGVWVPAHMA